MVPFSKEDNDQKIKSLYECKGCNTQQFITVSGLRLDEEQHQQAAGEVEKVRNSVSL